MKDKLKVNQRDSLGLRQGFWRMLYTNGKLMYEGNFINSERNGVFKDYHINGQFRGTGNYINARLEGEVIIDR
jgi:antitoxin component YwqK of YwqJK toxin-antitoxin module